LNILARTCAIATHVHNIVALVKRETPHYRGVIAATRKTTPGFRLAEKYAVVVGGGKNVITKTIYIRVR
jgi:nicotinate-nucleotide pyrophosphorylase (carboxylating)